MALLKLDPATLGVSLTTLNYINSLKTFVKTEEYVATAKYEFVTTTASTIGGELLMEDNISEELPEEFFDDTTTTTTIAASEVNYRELHDKVVLKTFKKRLPISILLALNVTPVFQPVFLGYEGDHSKVLSHAQG